VEELLAKANRQIERVKLLQRGDRLYIRGRFPPKPGDGDQPKRFEAHIMDLLWTYKA